jgi:hypothetical protein
MTPRNPDDSYEETVQDEILQAVHEALTNETSAQAAPAERDTPIPAVKQEERQDTKVEPDRVEIYLKGPTVFSA